MAPVIAWINWRGISFTICMRLLIPESFFFKKVYGETAILSQITTHFENYLNWDKSWKTYIICLLSGILLCFLRQSPSKSDHRIKAMPFVKTGDWIVVMYLTVQQALTSRRYWNKNIWGIDLQLNVGKCIFPQRKWKSTAMSQSDKPHFWDDCMISEGSKNIESPLWFRSLKF